MWVNDVLEHRSSGLHGKEMMTTMIGSATICVWMDVEISAAMM